VAWRLSGDLSGIIAGLRALLVQALHPLAMAGVDQHSNWRQDPVGRLAATTQYTTTVTFGERAAAEQAAAIVRRIHDRDRGTDPQTGQPSQSYFMRSIIKKPSPQLGCRELKKALRLIDRRCSRVF
jgi:uncharacterized protein (DUF2236 family)